MRHTVRHSGPRVHCPSASAGVVAQSEKSEISVTILAFEAVGGFTSFRMRDGTNIRDHSVTDAIV